jgi:hypothetical protein
LISAAGFPRAATSAHDGAFHFDSLAPGKYTLTTGAQRHTIAVPRSTPIEVDILLSEVTLVVGDAETGDPIAGAEILVWPFGAEATDAEALGILRAYRTRESGVVDIHELPHGRYRVAVDAVGYRGGHQAITIAGANERFSLWLTADPESQDP